MRIKRKKKAGFSACSSIFSQRPLEGQDLQSDVAAVLDNLPITIQTIACHYIYKTEISCNLLLFLEEVADLHM